MRGTTNKDQHKAGTTEQTRSTRTQEQFILRSLEMPFRPSLGPPTSHFRTRRFRNQIQLAESTGEVRRHGLGRGRHQDVRYLWIQEKISNGDFHDDEVLGTENPAELMTKLLGSDRLVGSARFARELHAHRSLYTVPWRGP